MKPLRTKLYLTVQLITIAALISLSGVQAQVSLLHSEYPESYTVMEGDTLWNIASQFLREPDRWPEIWRPDPYLDNSDLIYPGDILRVGFVGGAPRILVQRGDRDVERIGPEIRAEELVSAIPAIPLESIENSFTRNRIITRELYNAAAYIVENLGANLIIGTGDEVYARGTWPIGTSSFEIYRAGRGFMDESGEELIGLEAEYLGFATIADEDGPELRRLAINNSSKEIRVGARLLIREESRIGATIFPTEPVSDIAGEVIAFLGGEALASQLDTVVIDLGLQDNLAVGDILSV
ncbi:MAG TPA: peptidoglycan-binding protein [Gammaproteobacteria bacterium]|jgi:hypothetical protein|nr:LysM peptidoglycan-binding domain-containing protein [Gammaproteobacteria bacterium]MDP6732594.1 LysM peptidoglycan-binding domain-containing protein [Gammaproteobacteria bacterium]HAJ77425.1 peptidoglycan-binding protein [Gammaproteobacteria bacterium]|tara:strand:- start:4733 stop:5617 length:885 start_codon:yes stop_codon:yes gene_type:complete